MGALLSKAERRPACPGAQQPLKTDSGREGSHAPSIPLSQLIGLASEVPGNLSAALRAS